MEWCGWLNPKILKTSHILILRMILIIDNGSNFIKAFSKTLEEDGLEYCLHNHSEPLDFDKLSNVTGLILSGGEGSPYGPPNLTVDFLALMNFDVPTLGICLGHEVLGTAYRVGTVKLPQRQQGMQPVFIDKGSDPIFEGLKETIYLKKEHDYHVVNLPENFEVLAHSDVCPIEVMRHKTKMIYGFQAHPEASKEDGSIIMRNFLRMCQEYA